MSKRNRGKGIAHLPGKGKGICPICQRKSVKLLWEINKDGHTIKVCKQCANKR